MEQIQPVGELALALYVTASAVVSLVSRSRAEPSILGLGIAAASCILMPIIAASFLC